MHSSYWTIKFHISLYFQMNLFFQLLFKSLVVFFFFLHDVSSGLDKLSAQAIKCVFLQYSCLQKWYQCYSLNTEKYYMYTSVTFFEETFSFSSSAQDVNLVPQLLSMPLVEPFIYPITWFQLFLLIQILI